MTTLSWVPSGDEQKRAESLFRYTVRCDFATVAAIRRAAKKAGLSETTFVQKHFERILEAAKAREADRPADKAPPAPAPKDARDRLDEVARLRAGPGAPRREDGLRSSDLGVTTSAVRLARVAAAIADSAGVFSADTAMLGMAADVPAGNVTRQLTSLVQAGRLERVSLARPRVAARYKILKREV